MTEVMKRKFPSKSAGGKERVFKSYKSDAWRTKRDAEWAANFVQQFPEQSEAIVVKDGNKYRLWFRSKTKKMKRVRVAWTGTDGETKFESTLHLLEGNDDISDMIGQIEMLAEGYDVTQHTACPKCNELSYHSNYDIKKDEAGKTVKDEEGKTVWETTMSCDSCGLLEPIK